MMKFLIFSFVISLSLVSCTLSEVPASLPETKKIIVPETPLSEITPSSIPEATVVSVPAIPESTEDVNMEVTTPISPVVSPINPPSVALPMK